MNLSGKDIIGDRILFVAVLLLLFGSLPFAYSASGTMVFGGLDGNYIRPLMKRLVFSIISVLVILFFANRFGHRQLNKNAFLGYLLMMILLVMTLFTGSTENESRRALELPFISYSFQTAAFAQIAMVLFAANLLANKYHSEESRAENAKSVLLAMAFMALFTLSHGLSTTLILVGTVFFMLFVSKVSFKKIQKPLLIVVAVPFAYSLIAEIFKLPYRLSTWLSRGQTWVNGFSCTEITDENMQACLSKSAIADGGLFGRGLGQSPLRYNLPEAHSDFIYSYIVDEAGLIVGTLILVLYVVIFYRGIQIARNSGKIFPALAALGLTFLITFQALINIGVSVGMLPVTGQPLPFVSRGGSALLAASVAVGILLNISKGEKKPSKAKK